MKKVFWIALVVALLLPFGFKVSAVTLPHLWEKVGENPNRLSRLDGIKVILRDTVEAKRLVTETFPDTVWIYCNHYFDVVTYGNGKRWDNVMVGFDSTRALKWSGKEYKLYEVLGCTNLALEILHEPAAVPGPTPTNTANAPAFATTSPMPSEVTIPWKNWLAGILLLFLFGLVLALIYWVFRQINANPVPTGTSGTSPVAPPAPPMTEEEFNDELERHDENIRSMERMLQDERNRRQNLIDERLRLLDEAALATETERRRIRNLGSQH